MDNIRFVVAGYGFSGVLLVGYVLFLFRKARRARLRALAIAARRDGRD